MYSKDGHHILVSEVLNRTLPDRILHKHYNTPIVVLYSGGAGLLFAVQCSAVQCTLVAIQCALYLCMYACCIIYWTWG